MSKLKELEMVLDKRIGIKTTLKESDSNKEIMALKIKLEKIGNDLREVKNLPRGDSPLLKESLQADLDHRAGVGVVDNKNGKVKTDHDLLTESLIELSPEYSANASCSQCGWTGDITLKRGDRIGNAKCPGCGVSPGVLTRLKESNSAASLQASLDERTSEGNIRESAVNGPAIDSVIDLRESAYEDNTITFTLSEGSPEDFVGKKIYMNRPTKSELKERPERDLKSWVATITESILSKGKLLVKAWIHDEKLQELLAHPVSKKALGITMDSGNLCFVTDGQRLG